MEQQTRAKAAPRTEQTHPPAEQVRRPEQTRLSDAGLTARLALEGVSLLDLPPQRLEELAGFIGNSGMLALLELQTPPVEEAEFQPPGQGPGTAPFPVPDGLPLPLVQPGATGSLIE